jgi:predicted dehydrogenase
MTLKVGVIGVGHMGEYHTRLYNELEEVELAGVVDIDEFKAKRIGEIYNTRYFCDYHELLPLVDVVSIAVPTSLHYEVAATCLEEKKHVLLEKPMTTSLKDALFLFSLSEKKGVVLQVGHVERFNAAVQEVKRFINELYLIECRRLGPWIEDRITDTGVILDLIIHDVDIILSLVNSDKVEKINVAGKSVASPYEDIVCVQLIFNSGIIGTITASRVTHNKIRTLTITQKNSYIFLDYANQELHIHREAATHYSSHPNLVRFQQEGYVQRIFVHKDNPLKLELLHFIKSIIGNKKGRRQEEEKLKAETLESLSITLDIEQKLKEQNSLLNS